MKKCSKCSKTLDKNKFYINNGRYDGLSVYCKICLSLYSHNKYSSTEKEKVCLRCKAKFLGKSNKIYCGNCRPKKPISGYKKCIICHKEFPYRITNKVRPSNGIGHINQKFCSFDCVRESLRIRNKNPEFIKKFGGWNRGKKLSEEGRKKLSLSMVGKPKINGRGEKHHWWKGGITSKNKMLRSCLKYKNWRKSVFTRDNYTCQGCGMRGAKLQAHHLKSMSKFPDLMYKISNGQTLCIDCHKKTDTYLKNDFN